MASTRVNVLNDGFHEEKDRSGAIQTDAPSSWTSFVKRLSVYEKPGRVIVIDILLKCKPSGSTQMRHGQCCTDRCSWRLWPQQRRITWSICRSSGLKRSSTMASSPRGSSSTLSTILMAGCNWTRIRGVSPDPLSRSSSLTWFYVARFATLCDQPHRRMNAMAVPSMSSRERPACHRSKVKCMNEVAMVATPQEPS